MYRVNFLNSSCTSSFMLRFPNPKSLENKILLYINLVQVQMPRFPNPKYLENKILLYIYLVLVQMPRFPNPKSPESQILLYILLAQVSEISRQSNITIYRLVQVHSCSAFRARNLQSVNYYYIFILYKLIHAPLSEPEISRQSNITIYSSSTSSYMLRFPNPKSLDSQILLYIRLVQVHKCPAFRT